MKARVGIITSDNILYDKIRMLLRADAEVRRIEGDEQSTVVYEIVFVDIRNGKIPSGRCVTIGEGGDIPLPFKHEDVLSAFARIKDQGSGKLSLSDDGKHAYLSGRAVALTKLEYKLLERLLSEEVGSYVSRDELLRSVWGGACDPGVVVVYMHYLRKKLETDGEKIIITKRKKGDSSYKIDERYRTVR